MWKGPARADVLFIWTDVLIFWSLVCSRSLRPKYGVARNRSPSGHGASVLRAEVSVTVGGVRPRFSRPRHYFVDWSKRQINVVELPGILLSWGNYILACMKTVSCCVQQALFSPQCVRYAAILLCFRTPLRMAACGYELCF